MRARELLDPNFGKESQLDEGSFAASRTGLQDEPLAANHRRGYRGRSPRNSCGEQAARHAAISSCESADSAIAEKRCWMILPSSQTVVRSRRIWASGWRT